MVEDIFSYNEASNKKGKTNRVFHVQFCLIPAFFNQWDAPVQQGLMQVLGTTGKWTLCHVEFSHRTEEMKFLGTNQPTGSKGPPGIGVRWVANEISGGMVIKRTGGTHMHGGCKKNIIFFLYCTARQHPAQKASTQRLGQPAPMDIWEYQLILSVASNSLFHIL